MAENQIVEFEARINAGLTGANQGDKTGKAGDIHRGTGGAIGWGGLNWSDADFAGGCGMLYFAAATPTESVNDFGWHLAVFDFLESEFDMAWSNQLPFDYLKQVANLFAQSRGGARRVDETIRDPSSSKALVPPSGRCQFVSFTQVVHNLKRRWRNDRPMAVAPDARSR